MVVRLLLLALLISCAPATAQNSACRSPQCRAFDFWIGSWEVYGKNGQKAGESHVSLVLDSCVILEEWSSANPQNGFWYKAKSFNTFNTASSQWQQTWVDNTGNTTEYLRGQSAEGQVIFYADKVSKPNGEFFMRRLTFTRLAENTVRQLGEKSDDGGKTWVTEYDLTYRRKL